MAQPFSDNVVLLSGASSGIGRELALQLAAQGAWLALAARRPEPLEAVAAACRARGARALAVPTDVGDPDACAALVERTVEAYGRLDTLIANAGISMAARLQELACFEPIERVLRVNFLGAAACTYHALPHLQRTRGRIVAVASLTGKTGVPTRTAYAASKHAMAGFFDSLRIELAGSGVSVTVVYPGFVVSAIRERALGPDGRPLGRTDIDLQHAMPAEVCARKILRAAATRRRELVMTARGKLGLWLKLIAPALVDRIARRAIDSGR